MGKLKLIPFILFLTLSSQIFCQQFDLLKDYEPGKSIIYNFYRSATPSGFFNDTVSTITIFSGAYRTFIDSVTTNQFDSTRNYHLYIHKEGTETVRTSIRIISSRNIDTLYPSSIKEYLNSNYNSGSNRIEGWLFPDTVSQSLRCPYDTTIFNPFSYYYRYYNFPSADTFDVRGDSLILTSLSTDCLDIGFTATFIATQEDGLINRISSLYNYFGWSYTDVFTKDEVSDVKLSHNEPSDFYLYQNYPNPFNPTTTIKFTIPTPPVSSSLAKGRTKEGFVTLKVYDILGREIATLVNEEKPTGEYEVEFDGVNLPSGIYFYQLKAGNFVETKKMILLR